MGCDIHCYVEVRKTVQGNTEWYNCDNWRVDPYFLVGSSEQEYQISPIYSDRNYQLFTTLAGVRAKGLNMPIAEPRGLPLDVSEHTKKEDEYWGNDGHSHSHFTLFELKEWQDRNSVIAYSGYVSPEGAEGVEKGKFPEEWCQGTTDTTWVHREWTREERILEDLIRELEKRMRDVLWLFDDNTRYIKHEQNIRIVFWFDN